MKDTQAIEIARAHVETISRIMGLIGEKRFLSKPEKEEIQGLLKELKAALERDKKAIDSFKGGLTPCLSGFQAAISESEAELSSLRSNTDPIESNWFGDLTSAQINLQFFLDTSGEE